MPKVQFKTNIGSRHAGALGLAFADCTLGATADLDNDTIENLKNLCGEGSFAVVDGKAEKKAEAKPAMSDADLDKATAPKK